MKGMKNGWILGIMFFLLASALTALCASIGMLFNFPGLGVLGVYLAVTVFAFIYARYVGMLKRSQRNKIGLVYFIGNSIVAIVFGLIYAIYPYVFILTIIATALVFSAVIFWLLKFETLRYIFVKKQMMIKEAKMKAKEKALKHKEQKEMEEKKAKQKKKQTKKSANKSKGKKKASKKSRSNTKKSKKAKRTKKK